MLVYSGDWADSVWRVGMVFVDGSVLWPFVILSLDWKVDYVTRSIIPASAVTEAAAALVLDSERCLSVII